MDMNKQYLRTIVILSCAVINKIYFTTGRRAVFNKEAIRYDYFS